MTAGIALWIFLAAGAREVTVYGDGVSSAGALGQRLGSAWRVEAAVTQADPPGYAEGAAALAAGRKAYDGLLFEEAEPQLRRAVERLQAAPLEPAQWPALWQAYLWLALTYEAMGDEVKRDLTLDTLAALDLDGGIAGPELPPAFRERVRKRLATQPVKTGSLRVESVPSGAQVYVNGRLRGVTPLVVAGLPGGEHAVALTAPGRVGWQRRVAVRAGFGFGAEATPDLVEARLAPAAGGAAERILVRLRDGTPVTDAERSAAAQELAAAGKYAGVFAVRKGAAMQIYVVDANGAARGPEVIPNAADVAAQAAKRLLSPTTDTRKPAPAAPPAAVSTSRWWLWTSLGALAAGGATAAAIAASQDDSSAGRRSGEAVVKW